MINLVISNITHSLYWMQLNRWKTLTRGRFEFSFLAMARTVGGIFHFTPKHSSLWTSLNQAPKLVPNHALYSTRRVQLGCRKGFEEGCLEMGLIPGRWRKSVRSTALAGSIWRWSIGDLALGGSLGWFPYCPRLSSQSSRARGPREYLVVHAEFTEFGDLW